MNPHHHLETVQRWIALAANNFEGDFREIFTPDYAGHLAGRIHLDLVSLEETERGFASAFSSIVRTVHDLYAFEDRAVMRVTTGAVHSGTFRGIAPTGRAIQFTALVLYKFREGRICESWTEFDLAGLLSQLTAPLESAPDR